ncbi:hypothetical protein [Hymenobacter cellulosilyticus]|uniref:Uncharacterized protein n=1 Tax=Hymenobacter cellulosilyticus TaxID=2932248 RepID=A0A8T9QF34_9BACT|nr:hypothetical protein [Hymenobacter cellulosilyticus]UOQ73443.1 hypothetical protein MUN79_05720 [Hymenobacter cellulosilyticus]
MWLLSLVFFVGFRWRYFAEPAFLLYPLIVWQRLRELGRGGGRASVAEAAAE